MARCPRTPGFHTQPGGPHPPGREPLRRNSCRVPDDVGVLRDASIDFDHPSAEILKWWEAESSRRSALAAYRRATSLGRTVIDPRAGRSTGRRASGSGMRRCATLSFGRRRGDQGPSCATREVARSRVPDASQLPQATPARLRPHPMLHVPRGQVPEERAVAP